MPYIVTTGEPWGRNLGARDKYAVTSRRAVATLDEARKWVIPYIDRRMEDQDAGHGLRQSVYDWPAQGGSVSLPDGTVIEVAFTNEEVPA